MPINIFLSVSVLSTCLASHGSWMWPQYISPYSLHFNLSLSSHMIIGVTLLLLESSIIIIENFSHTQKKKKCICQKSVHTNKKLFRVNSSSNTKNKKYKKGDFLFVRIIRKYVLTGFIINELHCTVYKIKLLSCKNWHFILLSCESKLQDIWNTDVNNTI